MPHTKTRQLGYLAVAAVVALALLAGFASLAQAQTATSTGTTTTMYVFDAHLSGANEVPPVTSTSSTSTATSTASTTGHQRVWFNTTHASGTSATSSMATTTMWHALRVWNGTDIFAAHLHCGAAGQNGPVVVDLFNTPTTTAVDVNGTLVATTSITESMLRATTTGCSMPITNLNDLAAAMKAGVVYANVHSVEHPGGAARGQLMLTASSSTTTPPMGTSTPPNGTSTPPGTTTPPLPGPGLGSSINEFIRSLLSDDEHRGIGRQVSEFIRNLRMLR